MTADLLYSLTLLLAMISGSVALLASVQSRWRQKAKKLLSSLDRLSRNGRRLKICVLMSFVCLALSLWIHLTWGHGSASSEPMSGWLFFDIHPSYLVIFALQLLALWLYKPVS